MSTPASEAVSPATGPWAWFERALGVLMAIPVALIVVLTFVDVFGRYVFSARADDDARKPVAYLAFNDQLAAGPQEIKLTVFGKLLRDQRPPLPLRLRDVEGFLLYEDRDPDREQVAPRYGYLYTTKSYPESAFSTAEWQSEERDRHLKEFEKDVAEAKDQLDHLGKK